MVTAEEIKYYISQNENNGALLVTGKWGCGKTYLIRQLIDELNGGNENIAVAISLFGVDSIELLHKEIKNKVFFSRGFEKSQKKSKHIVSRIKNFSVTATDILGDSFSIAKSINKALKVRWQDYFNVEKYIYCYSEEPRTKKHLVKKKLVLFFDDFERSKLDRIELMGVINEYSENKEVKVIIIADEDKITEKEKTIEKDKEKINDNKSEKNTENNKYKYSEFKEKLISRTIKIIPDYKSTIDSIINSYDETVKDYKAFLIKNKSIIYRIYSESDTDNFRSVKAFIMDYERLHDVWQKSGISIELESDMFYNFGAMMFGVKMGIYTKGEYGFLFSDMNAKKRFSNWNSAYVFSSCQNWIYNGLWDENYFLHEINAKFNTKVFTSGEKFINYNLWDLEQTDIENGIPEITKMAYAGKLTRDQLINFLQKIHYLNDCSVPLPCNVDYSKLEKGFEIRKKKILDFEIIEPQRRTFSEKSHIDKEAYKLYEDIENFDKRMYTLETRTSFIKYLKSTSKRNSYDFRHKLIGCFDNNLLDLFYNRYIECDNEHKRDMCFTLLDISFTDNYYIDNNEIEETIKNLNELKSRLENSEQNKKDYITAIINKSFCEKIDSKVAQIKEFCKSNLS